SRPPLGLGWRRSGEPSTALLTTVGAIGVVQAGVGDQEVIEDLPPDEGLLDDPGHVLGRHAAVPDPLGVDHDGRAVLALIEAARVVGAGERPEAGLLQGLLEGVAQVLLALGVAAAALVAGLADVAADEDMVREGRHAWVQVPARGSRRAGPRAEFVFLSG